MHGSVVHDRAGDDHARILVADLDEIADRGIGHRRSGGAQDERAAMAKVMALQPLFEGLVETSLLGSGQRRQRSERSVGG